jgi:predicted nucleic acid-binding protein
MQILVDSNILLRLVNSADPQNQLAWDATRKLHSQNDDLRVVPQNIYEFWSAATRPIANNGLGLTSAQAQSEVGRFRIHFVQLDDSPAIYPQWEILVTQYAIVGKNVHDTRLVAAMIVHGITHLLTFNKQDLQRFTNITVLTPAEVMAMP